MIDMNDEMAVLVDKAQADGYVCLLGTASKGGEPQISPKGSMIVYDEETLAYWERSRRSAMENIVENPQVVIFYRNPSKSVNWRFHGKAKLTLIGDIRDKVMKRIPQAELSYDSEHKGAAVLVSVDQITQITVSSVKILQQREESRES